MKYFLNGTFTALIEGLFRRQYPAVLLILIRVLPVLLPNYTPIEVGGLPLDHDLGNIVKSEKLRQNVNIMNLLCKEGLQILNA